MNTALVLLAAMLAATVGNVERGRALAEKQCARCHAIKGPGPGPLKKAPAFSALGRRYPLENLAEAFAEGIVVGHQELGMPRFAFSSRQIDDLLAYLAAVQE